MLISSLIFRIAFDELHTVSIVFKFTSVRGKVIYSEKLLVEQRIGSSFDFDEDYTFLLRVG